MSGRDFKVSNIAKAVVGSGLTGRLTGISANAQKQAIDVESAAVYAATYAPFLKPDVTVDELMGEAQAFRSSKWEYYSMEDAVREVVSLRQQRMAVLFPAKWPTFSRWQRFCWWMRDFWLTPRW